MCYFSKTLQSWGISLPPERSQVISTDVEIIERGSCCCCGGLSTHSEHLCVTVSVCGAHTCFYFSVTYFVFVFSVCSTIILSLFALNLRGRHNSSPKLLPVFFLLIHNIWYFRDNTFSHGSSSGRCSSILNKRDLWEKWRWTDKKTRVRRGKSAAKWEELKFYITCAEI